MALSGVRISWLMLARKADLSRSEVFRDVPFDVQQDGGEVVAFNLHLSLVQIDGVTVSVAFFRNPVHLFAGSGYFDVLCPLFLGSIQGIKVKVILFQCLLYGDFAVI